MTTADFDDESKFREGCKDFKTMDQVKDLATKSNLIPKKTIYWECMNGVITTCV